MQKLLEFYTNSLLKVAATVVSLALLVSTIIVPWLEAKFPANPWPAKIVSWLTSGTSIGIVLALSEWLIRKKLWKIFHPELDFSGHWTGYTKYTHVRIGTTKKPVPFETRQEVVLRQDCLNLRLVPCEGQDFKFKSRAISIQEDGGQLVYAYLVEYAEGVEDRPREAYGYEWLDVVNTPEGARPLELSGKFGQCALGQEPVFSGEVHLKRTVKVEQLGEPLKNGGNLTNKPQ